MLIKQFVDRVMRSEECEKDNVSLLDWNEMSGKKTLTTWETCPHCGQWIEKWEEKKGSEDD